MLLIKKKRKRKKKDHKANVSFLFSALEVTIVPRFSLQVFFFTFI